MLLILAGIVCFSSLKSGDGEKVVENQATDKDTWESYVFGDFDLDQGCTGGCWEADLWVPAMSMGQRLGVGETLGAHVVNSEIFLQHICRSATLAGWGELYGRTGYNYIFSGEWGAVCHWLPD